LTFPDSLSEQQAIAAALSDADGVVAGLERVIAKKRLIKQGAMQDLLTARRRLPGFSGEWEVKRLGELGEVTGSGVDKKLREGEQPVRLLNYTDVYRETYIRSAILDHWVTAPEAKARRCAVRRGDVFFTPTSETPDDIARSAVAAEDIPDATYSYHVVRLRLKEQDSLDFWAHIFEIESFRAQARKNADGSGTRYVVTLPKFRNMTVRIPDRKEREAIGEILRDMYMELDALESRLAKARAVKGGMMHNLLTGRVRLV
jgi:type I restriction enzyme S subunit